MTFSWRLRRLTRVLPVAAVVLGSLSMGAPSAVADDDPVGPPLHNVKYTVFSEQPFRNAQIYYRDVDPPNFAEYSHNPYAFSPSANADTGPSQMWSIDVMLANPDDWAMVTVGSLDSPKRPNFHCVLAVDGQVVSTNQGPKGALCSIRNW
ncbi:MAG: hypothetical protein JWQ86_2804 [Mycobacterium sp.]|jgi:hypothetical protein|nr:hypothetical protein [Mycobacterium sp.]MDT5217153.1 hypothetical protein [Mycobacterium sp.]